MNAPIHAILKSAQQKPLSYISRTKNREKKIQAAAFIWELTVIEYVLLEPIQYKNDSTEPKKSARFKITALFPHRMGE